MEYGNEKNSSHNNAGEQFVAPESFAANESAGANELLVTPELSLCEEVPTLTPAPRSKRGRSDPAKNKLVQYLATLTVGGVAGVSMILPLAISDYKITDEVIDFDSYACVLTMDDDERGVITAVDEHGEIYHEMEIAGGQKSYSITIDYLRPEQEYTLRFHSADETEPETLTTFGTHSFITLGAQENGELPFSLHPELKNALEMSISLYSADGKDYSSSIFRTDVDRGLIFTENLHAGEYYLELGYYDGEGMQYVDKLITPGALSPLKYQAEYAYAPDYPTLTLTKVSGDLGPYTALSIELMDYGSGQTTRIADEQITYNPDGTMTVRLETELDPAAYELAIWGRYVDADLDYEFYNCIYTGDVTSSEG